MRVDFLILFFLLLFGCDVKETLNGEDILRKSISAHDPSDLWEKTLLHINIQEPRISNPQRYSILRLDNATGYFMLSRNRDQHISEHIIDSAGNSIVRLDGQDNIDEELVKKYRLAPSRNIGYKNFYELLYGLPMSLDGSIKEIVSVSESIFKEEDCYRLAILLKEPMISDQWNVFIAKSNMQVRGVEMKLPDKPDGGERIYFDELITINGIKIPRIRHWHEFNDSTYSGTDLIITEVGN